MILLKFYILCIFLDNLLFFSIFLLTIEIYMLCFFKDIFNLVRDTRKVLRNGFNEKTKRI